jgi:acyl-CoA synthetase (AMP-forming)/AMP-acid ligase II
MTVTLAALLTEHPFADGEGLLHSATESITAGEARAAAQATAAGLRALGVQPGQAVAVQLPNEPRLITTVFGVWMAGAVFVPVNPRHPAGEVAAILEETRPAAVVDAGGARALTEARTYAAADAFITWTSGTSGRPKPVLHTHEGYLELLDRVLGPLRGHDRDDSKRPTPNLIPVSLALNAGIYNALFGLRAGAALVIMDRFRPAEFAELVRRFEIRSTVLPPAALAMLTDDPAITSLTPLRYVRSITAPLSPRQAQRFAVKFPVTVLNGYGQAELGEVIGWTAADARAHPDKVGAVGRPHPGVDIRLDGAGQLLVRPPRTAVGLEARTDAEGFVATGDIATIDDEGFVWIEGRLGDVINRGGNKVHPQQVEEILRSDAAVDDVAVVGVPDDRLGEVPVAFLVGRESAAADLDALCRAHLAPYKVPVGFHWIDELPRNEVGKVLRHRLREIAR